MPWGYHLIIDARECNKEKITSGDNIAEFSRVLVKRIDMVAYGEPQVVHFAEHDPEKAGYTLIQLIETSNIAAHFCDNSGDAYFDVFSCKPFDNDTVIDTVAEFFEPSELNTTFLTRG